MSLLSVPHSLHLSMFPLIAHVPSISPLSSHLFVCSFVCVSYPPIATACVERKRDVSCKLEQKIEAGIEKTIAQMLSSVKQILATNQKKTDYRPDTPLAEGTRVSGCSLRVEIAPPLVLSGPLLPPAAGVQSGSVLHRRVLPGASTVSGREEPGGGADGAGDQTAQSHL